MDSNVSKNTNSHKLFKISLNQAKPTISMKNLLKQQLLSTCDLYQQKFDVQIKHQFIATTIEHKMALANPKIKCLSPEINTDLLLCQPQSIPIIYSCPLGLFLASYLQISLQMVTDNLEKLLILTQNNLAAESKLRLQVAILSSGWLNFYLDSQTIVTWLERSLFVIKNNTIDNQSLSTAAKVYALDKTPDNLFSSQYIHARCCSLLRLGAREKLITLQGNFEQIGWQLKQPQSISWSDREHNLWLTELSAYNLLRQLLMVADAFASNSDNDDWFKIALSLSQTTAIFLTDCRFLGEVKQQYLQKAIARLALIALVQYWLQRILVEKLNIMAPTEL